MRKKLIRVDLLNGIAVQIYLANLQPRYVLSGPKPQPPTKMSNKKSNQLV